MNIPSIRTRHDMEIVADLLMNWPTDERGLRNADEHG